MPIHYITLDLPRDDDAYFLLEKLNKSFPEIIDQNFNHQKKLKTERITMRVMLPDSFEVAKVLAESWVSQADMFGLEDVSATIHNRICLAEIYARPLKNKFAEYEKAVRHVFPQERLEIIAPTSEATSAYVRLFDKNPHIVQAKFRVWLSELPIQHLICKNPSYETLFSQAEDKLLWSMHQKDLLEKDLRALTRISPLTPKRKF